MSGSSFFSDFLTRREVRRTAGFWCQHSCMILESAARMSSLCQREGICGRIPFIQTASCMSWKLGSLGTHSWYGSAYSSLMTTFVDGFVVVHRLQISQNTRPNEYMSAILKLSNDFVSNVWSRTSGLMYLQENSKRQICISTIFNNSVPFSSNTSVWSNLNFVGFRIVLYG